MGSGVLVDKADLVLLVAPASEVGTIAIVHQCEDAAADRDTRFAHMAGLLRGGAESANLGGLLNVERLSGLVVPTVHMASKRSLPTSRPPSIGADITDRYVVG